MSSVALNRVEQLFKPESSKIASDQAMDRLAHCGINLGARTLPVWTFQFSVIPRGVMFPVFEYGRKEPNADFTDSNTGNGIALPGESTIYRVYQPGVIARAIERDWQNHGLKIFWNHRGIAPAEILEATKCFFFYDLKKWPNSKIETYLGAFAEGSEQEFQALAEGCLTGEYLATALRCKAEEKYLDIAAFIKEQLRGVDYIQKQHMAEAQASMK